MRFRFDRGVKKKTIAVEYELSLADWDRLKRVVDRINSAAVKGNLPEAIQSLNAIWKDVGDRMGFDWKSARPCGEGKSSRYVKAFPKSLIT